MNEGAQIPARPDLQPLMPEPAMRRKSLIEWLALVVSWGAALVWGSLAWAALGGWSYPFVRLVCGAAIRDAPLDPWSTIQDRAVGAAWAVVVLAAGALLAAFAYRSVPRQIAATRAAWAAGFIIFISFGPLIGMASTWGLPYLLGLNIRAWGLSRPLLRRILTPLACIASTLGAVVWGDGMQCL